MKNKKASATVVILIVSMIMISSGIIITNEVKKSNNENKIVGTGLVLLDNGQDNFDSLSDSLDAETEVFYFDSSRKESSSKKKSSSSKSSSKSSSINDDSSNLIEENNSLNIQTNNKILDNLGTSTVSNESLEFQQESIGTQFSDGQIFEENGVEYIVRDSAAYALSSSDFYIEFDPILPSKVCENEKIDITVKGKTRYFPDIGESIDCANGKTVLAPWCISLMEDDGAFPDDLVRFSCGSSKIFDCTSSGSYFYFEKDFSNIDLSDWIIPDVGTNGEFYTKIEGDKITFRSTSSYDVSVDYNCQCSKGACCDLGSRPYEYKPSGSQPTGFEDSFFCSGTNSPTGTNYCKEGNYYCSGNDEDSHYSESTKDTCGICEYCTGGDPTCNYYSTSTKCGTRDCDYLDTTCRNYDDIGRFCAGNSGTCKTASCTSYIDTKKGTSCGANNECDGSGSCITCTANKYTSCYDNDVYSYDSCDNREEKKKECGEDYTGPWSPYCKDNDKWEKRSCATRGCDGSSCYEELYNCGERFVEACQYGCFTNGNCKPDPNIECSFNSDCGTNGYTGNLFCSDEDVYESFITHTCNDPGTISSYCSESNTDVLREDCQYGCRDGACIGPEPDLTIIDLAIQNINGKIVVLAFTVKNIGELAAENIYWMVDTDSSDTNPERTVSTSLEPGSWTRAYMMLNYSQLGTYQPEAIVDFDNLIIESNENNNRQSLLVTI